MDDLSLERLRRVLIASRRDALPAHVREQVLANPAATFPMLLAVLQDDSLYQDDSAGQGWAPGHAARLLAEIGDLRAVAPMLECVRKSDLEVIALDPVILATARFGAAALEPTLAALAGETNGRSRSNLMGVLAHLGIRDERIFEVLVRQLEVSPAAVAIDLSTYGDKRAIDLLSDIFDRCRDENTDREPDGDVLDGHAMEIMKIAIEDLGARLRPDQYERWRVTRGIGHAMYQLLRQRFYGVGPLPS